MSLDLHEPTVTPTDGRRQRRLPPWAAWVAVAAALVLPGAWVVTAGGGHEPAHVPAAGAAVVPEVDAPTAADVCFVEMMIPHHEQAVLMSDLLLAKPGVWERGRRFAEFVRAAQAREVETMRRWLDAWGAAAHGPHANAVSTCDHSGPMPGMLTGAEMTALRTADAPAAQLLYLQLMIPHHDGALEMAYDEIAAGSNVYAISVAKHVVEDQLGEIGAMESMIAELTAGP